MDNSQHDSHEFLIHLMEILEDEFKIEYNEDQLTILNKQFKKSFSFLKFPTNNQQFFPLYT